MIILLGSILTRFKGLFDVVFINEKWFYLTRKSERYYLLPYEDEPLSTCRSKNNIPVFEFQKIKIRTFQTTSDGKITKINSVDLEKL